MLSKIKNIQKVLRKRGIDFLLVTSDPGIRYVLDRYDQGYGGMICIPRDKLPFMIASVSESNVLKGIGIEMVPLTKIRKAEDDIKPSTKLGLLTKELKNRKIRTKNIALELEALDVLTYEKIKEKIKGKYHNFSETLLNIKSIKTKEEIAILKKGAKITVRGMKAVKESLTPGMTERELANVFESEVRKHADWFSFNTIVASGKNSAQPHYTISNRKIGSMDFVVVDGGLIYKNQHTDITRTFCLSPSKKQKTIYKIVLEAQRAALAKLKIGKRASYIDSIAREHMKKRGDYDKYFIHGLGHGVGTQIHEKPSFDPESTDVLKENMIFTIEPGIYIPGFGGVRIEDMVLLTKKGKQVLTKFPRRLNG